MADPFLHAGDQVLCQHGAAVQSVVTQNRVRVSGQPVATLSDQYPVSGCAFTVAAKPQSCARIQWVSAARRVRVNGSPVLLSTTPGTCLSAESIPQGKANPVSYQQRARGE